MKIAFIVNSFPKISETFIFNKIARLSESDFEVTVLVHQVSNDKNFYNDKSVFNRIHIIFSLLLKRQRLQLLLNPISFIRAFKLTYNSKSNLKGNLRNSLLLFPFIKNKYDIVHFEYSGLDDPHKLILDFICQPDKQINFSQARYFIKKFYNKFSDFNISMDLLDNLEPLYRIKWCCIMLNKHLSRGSRVRFTENNLINLDNDFLKVESYYNKYLKLK